MPPPPELSPADEAPRVYAVSELTGELRDWLEGEVGRVQVWGEISNLFLAASGHAYFTLKDAQAQLRAVLFKGNARRLAFDPEDGLEVIAEGELSVYPQRGDLQLIVRRLAPRGLGGLQIAFEQLRRRLEAEGLFAPENRRPLPAVPRRVGVVTSPHGAAIHDVIEVSGSRAPGVPILLAPSRVQGPGADEELVAALERLATRDVDVILLVRGGGSLEDLAAFNTERVARAVRACPVPVVSGVGHETDVTISDLAADARAPTPSAAAMHVFPDGRELVARVEHRSAALLRAASRRIERLEDHRARLEHALHASSPQAALAARAERLQALHRALPRALLAPLGEARSRLGAARDGLRNQGPARRLPRERERVARRAEALVRSTRAQVSTGRGRLATAAGSLEALSPLAVLSRGYAIVEDASGGVVRRAAEVPVGARVEIRLAEGRLRAEVTETASDDRPKSSN